MEQVKIYLKKAGIVLVVVFIICFLMFIVPNGPDKEVPFGVFGYVVFPNLRRPIGAIGGIICLGKILKNLSKKD